MTQIKKHNEYIVATLEYQALRKRTDKAIEVMNKAYREWKEVEGEVIHGERIEQTACASV